MIHEIHDVINSSNDWLNVTISELKMMVELAALWSCFENTHNLDHNMAVDTKALYS